MGPPTTPPARLRRGPSVAFAALLAATALAACASANGPESAGGGRDEGDGESNSLPSADRYLQAGDYDRAVYQYERIARDRPDDAELAEKLRTARLLAAQRHADAAVEAASRDDLERAAWEMGQAERFDKNAVPVRVARSRIGARLEAVRDLDAAKAAAREQMATDPAGAADTLAELRRRAPADDELTEMLTTATLRAEGDAAAVRAEASWTSGDRRRAVEHLAVATVGGRPCPLAMALRRRMETDLIAESTGATLAVLRADFVLARDAALSAAATDAIRDRLAEALLREARRHEDAAHPATAALFEIEASRTGAKVERRNEERVRASSAVVLHVLPFDDATGGSVDGTRLGRAVRDRLTLQNAGGSAAIQATLESASAAATPRSFPHLAVVGTALSQRVTSGRVGRETRNVRYVSGSRDAANPDVVQFTAALEEIRGRLARAREIAVAADTNLRQLKSLAFATAAGATAPSENDPAHQKRLADAETRVANANRAAKAVEREELDIRQKILTTPGTVSQAVWKERPVEVTTLVKTAEIVARVRVLDGATVLLDERATGSDVHRETTAPGWEPGGIAPDPDESPDDATMAARAADELAGAVVGKIRDAAERAARSLLEDARAAEGRGDTAGAGESYALFLLSTSETATLERAGAARALTEILGAPPAVRTGFTPEVRR